MPLPFAWLIAFALGAAFARAAAGEIARTEGPLLLSRPTAIVGSFALFVLAPVVGYFTAFHGDWTYLYLFDWQSVPSAIDLVLVLASGALVLAGFAAAIPPIRAKRARTVDVLIGAPMALALVLALAFARRLAVSASHAQYVGAMGVESIASSVLGKGVVLAMLTLGAGAAWATRALRAA